MKNSSVFLCLLVSVTLLQVNVFAQLKYLNNVSKMPEHPRLLLQKGEEKGIQKNIDSDPNWDKIQVLVSSASAN